MLCKAKTRASTAKWLERSKARVFLSAAACALTVLMIGAGTAGAETEFLLKSENLKDLTSMTSALENLGIVRSLSNTALGREAFISNTTGKENTVYGSKAMKSNKTGEENTVIGNEADPTAEGASKNTAIGNGSMHNAETGAETNVAVGNNTLFYATTASENTALGNSALAGFYKLPITGRRNTAVGREAGAAISDGERNTDIGFNADDENETGSENTAVGTDALGKPKKEPFSTSKDTALGMNAGLHDEGNGDIFLGWEAGANAENVSNMLYIDNSSTEAPLILGNFETGVLKVNGKLEVTETAAVPAKPLEGEEANIGTARVASRKTSFTITGNGVRTKWTLKHGLATRLVNVSVQKGESEQPGELELPTTYKVKPTSTNEVQITFVAAPGAGEEKFITVVG